MHTSANPLCSAQCTQTYTYTNDMINGCTMVKFEDKTETTTRVGNIGAIRLEIFAMALPPIKRQYAHFLSPYLPAPNLPR